MLAIRIGLRWRPSCAQVSCSTSSSSVPTPPGSATKASARSNISRLRSCRSRVMIRSCARISMCSRSVRNSGMMPVTIAAMVEDRFGAGPHQAGRAAAVDEPDAVLGQDSAEPACRLHEGRVGARTGAAIDADRFDFAHVDSGYGPACGAAGRDRQGGRPVCTAEAARPAWPRPLRPCGHSGAGDRRKLVTGWRQKCSI